MVSGRSRPVRGASSASRPKEKAHDLGENLIPNSSATPPLERLSTPRLITGSLPLDFRSSEDSSGLLPAAVFTPTHLRSALADDHVSSLPIHPDHKAARVAASTATTKGASVYSAALTAASSDASSSPSASAATARMTTTETLTGDTSNSFDGEFLKNVGAMLDVGNSDVQHQQKLEFRTSSVNASYDFDEYAFLRNPDDPYALPSSTGGEKIPSDPRFHRFMQHAENGIATFVNNVRVSLGAPGNDPQVGIIATSLQQTLMSWWRHVCSIRAFNRLTRYSRFEIAETWSISPEEFYAESLNGYLLSFAQPEARGFLVGNGDSSALGKLLTVTFWEKVLTSVFREYFGNFTVVDPTASQDEYPFDAFPIDEILFGLQVVHRQTWKLLGYARSELVKSIPLGPKESHKVSTKILLRRKMVRTSEEVTSTETTAETSSTAKDTSEVVTEASKKLNRHLEAEVSGGYGSFFQAKVSGGISEDTAASSKETKSRLNEMMQKTASRIKRDTKVTVSTEGEESFEEARATELVNPNDEIAITYLYHRLQQQYWVSTEVAEVHSVVFVPELLPAWEEINEGWVRKLGEIIAQSLLDQSFAPILAAIRKEPANLTYTQDTTVFGDAAKAGIDAAEKYKDFTGGGRMPDLLASGQQFFERDFERRNNLAMDQARREHQSLALLTHIRRNILHYMRAIWSSEDHDQRTQRYSRMRVCTAWYFVPRTPLPSGSGSTTPLEVEGIFVPDPGSARPLNEVIDPIGPIGYLFNCAIYRLRDDPKVIGLHQALSYLRAAYTRFSVSVEISENGGVTFRHAVAYAPRSFSTSYTFTYRTNRTKWLIPVPGRTENDWFEVKVLPDGSLDALGLRIWLDGDPTNGAVLAINVKVMSDLEDPHLKLVQMMHPLPSAADEAQVFTDNLLREMVTALPELTISNEDPLTWASLSEADKSNFRKHYHRFVMLRESGRVVSLDTANLVLDLEASRSPALEPFKRLHRYVDVLKEYQELRRRNLDNIRREELLNKGVLGDPDIEKVTVVGRHEDIKDVIVIPEEPEG